MDSIFNLMVNAIMENNRTREDKVSATDEEILCTDEVTANAIADLLDAMGYEAVTGHYDEDEDRRNGQVDELTGLYYVSV